ncbi:MAG: tyrosine-type recombinase/integrase, partial [Halobacteriales archaeon]
KTPVTPEQLVETEDLSALFDAVTEPRDAALLGTLLATGQRISAVLSIRVGDVDLGGKSGVVHLNDEALGLKGASGPRPLLWATGFVSRWLGVHPRADEDDAPLFCTLKSGVGGNEQTAVRRYEEGDVLSRHQAHSRLKDLAEAAGVDPVKVKPHNLRHAAITRMVREGLDEQKIKWLVGWARDSSQFKRYQHLTDDQMLEDVLDEYGLAEEDVDSVGKRERTVCDRCDTPLRPGASWCDNCGLALTHAAFEAEQNAEADVNEVAAQLPPEVAVDFVNAVNELKESPEIRAFMSSQVDDLDVEFVVAMDQVHSDH